VRRFSNEEDLLRAWDDECAQIPEETWESWFDDWFQRMQKYIERGGKYCERLWKLKAYCKPFLVPFTYGTEV
jgi:hypothetical protein